MRRSLGKLPNPATLANATKQTFLLSSSSSSSAYSTSSGGGGRGRGTPNFNFVASTLGKPNPDTISTEEQEEPPIPSGVGHGRGKPLPSTPPILPSFASAPRVTSSPSAGPGRGRGATVPQPQPTPGQEPPQNSGPRKPIFFLREDVPQDSPPHPNISAPKPPLFTNRVRNPEDTDLPTSILSALSGAGRGKPVEPSSGVTVEKVKEQNRHIRPRRKDSNASAESDESKSGYKKKVAMLRQGDDGGLDNRGGRGGRGRGFKERGRGRGFRGGRGRRNVGGRDAEGSDDDNEDDLVLGDDADGERLANKLGPEKMNQLVEAFDEMSSRVLPSPMDDAFIDAMHTNYMIECEPEYLMEEFGTNPDIDEKPPIPLREALEKMKPFLMAYEGIKDQQEWEDVMKETMEKVPIIKELVDYYSGPDRVTAKRQQKELERVAKTLPQSADVSVKRFADRAVLSLQASSNPGWGFDKKCQFMDKLVWEVSQHYK
ncbi:hypothetical protein RJ639_029099 [Escallonia herrerae]|uniref:Hydroxyproline-rich glycoprotein family protein n=1 Tax=Escallonia herrerae TaxID=1293975 RepID=A0AA88X7J2_9ASTE|nr:hypothetical protein RJ639_029099 [Escallonia herrerae]